MGHGHAFAITQQGFTDIEKALSMITGPSESTKVASVRLRGDIFLTCVPQALMWAHLLNFVLFAQRLPTKVISARIGL